MKKISQLFEKFYPTLIGISVYLLNYFIFELNFKENRISDLLSSSINVSSVLMGFVGVANAVILSLDSKIVKDLKNHKFYWNRLIDFLRCAIYSCVLLFLYSIVILSIENRILDNAQYNLHAFSIWVALIFCSFSCFVRISRIFFYLLERENKN